MKAEVRKKRVYVVGESETLDSVAKKLSVSIAMLKSLNGITEVEEGDALLVPEEESRFYVVKPADTVEQIARKMGVSKTELIEKNGKNFFIGQKIYF